MKESKIEKMMAKQKDRIAALSGKVKDFSKSGHVPGPVGAAITVASAGLAGAIDGLTGSESMTAAWVIASAGAVAGSAAHMAGAATIGNAALDAAAGPASALAYHYGNKGTASLRIAAMKNK